MKKMALALLAVLATTACKQDNLPPESRCTMYWDYYYNAGLGKSEAEKQSAKGVVFDDIRAIIKADPSKKTRVCQKILNDAFPNDEVLKLIEGPVPTVDD